MVGLEMYSWIAIAVFCKYVTAELQMRNISQVSENSRFVFSVILLVRNRKKILLEIRYKKNIAY